MTFLRIFLIILIYSSTSAFGNNFEGVLTYKMTTTPRVTEERFQNLRVTYKGHFMRIEFDQLSKTGKEKNILIVDFQQKILKVAFEAEKKYFYHRIDDLNLPNTPAPISLSRSSVLETIQGKEYKVQKGKIMMANKQLDFKAWYHPLTRVNGIIRYVPQFLLIASELDFLNYLVSPQDKTILVKSQFQNPDESSTVVVLSNVEKKVVDQAIFYLDEKFLKEAKSLNRK